MSADKPENMVSNEPAIAECQLCRSAQQSLVPSTCVSTLQQTILVWPVLKSGLLLAAFNQLKLSKIDDNKSKK